ncbi:MAG: hypothetical protein V4586_20440 [Pseudomonadota bacterium]
MRPNGSVYVPELTKIRISLESLASREAVRRITDAEIRAIVALNDANTDRNDKRDHPAHTRRSIEHPIYEMASPDRALVFAAARSIGQSPLRGSRRTFILNWLLRAP